MTTQADAITNTMIDSPGMVSLTVWGGLMDPAGAIVNEYSVLSIPAFYSGVRFISETLASLSKSIYRSTANTRQAVDHPLNKLLARRVNKYRTTPFQLFETWHSHAVIHGNAYAYIDRDPATQRPAGLYTLNPEAVVPFRYNGEQWYSVRGGAKDGKNAIVPGADIVHLAGLGFDGLSGYPLVYLMYEALGLARDVQRFAGRYLKRGTQVQGAIEVPGLCTKEQRDQIRQSMEQYHAGLDSPNTYGYALLTGGAKLNNSTISPEQSQLLQSRQFSVLDMCRILRVPPHVVYDLGRATWANVEAMGREVVTYSLRPWVEKAEQELSGKLLTDAEQDAGYYVRYAVGSLTRGDTATQTSSTLSKVNGGLMTTNEGRAALDLPPVNDPLADRLRVPVNFPVPNVTPTTTDAPPVKPDAAGQDEGFAHTTPAILPTVNVASFQPIIADAVKRVEAKTTKAFAAIDSKPPAERTPRANALAEEQARYVADALQPVVQTMAATTGVAIDAAKIGQTYAHAIRARASGAEHQPLAQIVADAMK